MSDSNQQELGTVRAPQRRRTFSFLRKSDRPVSNRSCDNAFVDSSDIRKSCFITLAITTWSADSHGLFDFDSKNVLKKVIKISCLRNIYFIVRFSSDIHVLTEDFVIEFLFAHSSAVVIAKLVWDGHVYAIHYPQAPTSDGKFGCICAEAAGAGRIPVDSICHTCPSCRVSEHMEKLWLLLKSSKKMTQPITTGDIVKLGRFKLRVKEIVLTDADALAANVLPKAWEAFDDYPDAENTARFICPHFGTHTHAQTLPIHTHANILENSSPTQENTLENKLLENSLNQHQSQNVLDNLSIENNVLESQNVLNNLSIEKDIHENLSTEKNILENHNVLDIQNVLRNNLLQNPNVLFNLSTDHNVLDPQNVLGNLCTEKNVLENQNILDPATVLENTNVLENQNILEKNIRAKNVLAKNILEKENLLESENALEKKNVCENENKMKKKEDNNESKSKLEGKKSKNMKSRSRKKSKKRTRLETYSVEVSNVGGDSEEYGNILRNLSTKLGCDQSFGARSDADSAMGSINGDSIQKSIVSANTTVGQTISEHGLGSLASAQNLCRICLCESEEPDDVLVSPCDCKGSMQYVHLRCLRTWMAGRCNMNNESNAVSFFWQALSCELCRCPYPALLETTDARAPVELFEIQRPAHPYIILEPKTQVGRGLYVISFANRSILKLGRGHDSDIRFSDISVSRVHASLKLNGDQVCVEDLASKFGTLIEIKNAVPLYPNAGGVSFRSNRTVITVFVQKARPKLFSCFSSGINDDDVVTASVSNSFSFGQSGRNLAIANVLPSTVISDSLMQLRAANPNNPYHNNSNFQNNNTIELNIEPNQLPNTTNNQPTRSEPDSSDSPINNNHQPSLIPPSSCIA